MCIKPCAIKKNHNVTVTPFKDIKTFNDSK